MKWFIFIVYFFTACCSHAQVADSIKRLLPFATSDTARVALYIQIAAEGEDSTALLYSDSAQQLVQALLPAATGNTKTGLNNYLSECFYHKASYFAGAMEAYDSAIHYYHKALQPALAAGNRKQEAQILNDLSVCAYFKNDMLATIDYQRKSLAIREELQDEEQLRSAYNNMAFVYKENGLVDSSLDFNFKALALAEKMNADADISTSLNNIAEVYHKYLLDYPKALEYYNKSRVIRERLGNKKDIGLINNNIASLYSDMGNYTQAIQYYKKSLEQRRAVNSKFGIAQTLSNLAYNYLAVKDYGQAKTALAESMQVNESLQDKHVEEGIRFTYAKLYNALNMRDSAIYHARLSHNINLEFGNPLDISLSAELLSKLYEKENNYQEALVYYKLFKTMQDSVLNEKLKKVGIKKELEYQYLKKQTELDKIHQAQIAEKNLHTSLLMLLFVTAAVTGFFLWNRYRLKQQLKEVQLRNKIASDLHDDVGSTLSSIRMYSDIVSTQIQSTFPFAKELLAKVSSNSKEMIENMSDIVWMIKPGNDDFKNTEDRMLNFANELCLPAGINFELTRNTDTSNIKMPMEQRRDIYLIFKEALNNAVKYASCHAINAGITLTPHHLKLQISDDGSGFDTSTIKKGNGLDNMNMRAAAHNGTLHIQSMPGQGTSIITIFPLK